MARRGTTLESLLEEEGIAAEVYAEAAKKVLAWQLQERMKSSSVSKAELARRMETSRAQVDRILNPEDISVSLRSMAKVAAALGARISLTLEAP